MNPLQPDVALRRAMVDRLKGLVAIRGTAVEAAMRAVPRHLFAPWLSLERAYEDTAFPVPGHRPDAAATISQPLAVALMLEGDDLRPGMRVLEIGAGTGYNAALVAHIVGEAGRVTTIDIPEAHGGRVRPGEGRAW